ncbi:phosphoglucosamine mutase [Vulcanimicrobium alpinum]|uniref:Phosphoglucosamine mutase n=1 Tax=Vulcanimicrobium alpinum TaxID=3016050 RepID=A0AAN2C9M3_UNVUL|nr:phosphoglucosamine mutase [Vulcanimicrobium alpinum]BDE06449.1 phosphoglucosamine mutase [Vulcanimicrobium alpinum]
MGTYFGTDGVRGVANGDLTPELAYAVGRAGAAVIAHAQPMDRPIVVGRDTRLSGPMLEGAIVAGITSTGRNVLQVGVVPTPGVAAITTRIEAAAGVMISASHNPIEDNGIKFFGADGFKLSDATESEIESLLADPSLPRPTGLDIGIASHARGLIDRYFSLLVEAGGDLSGLTIVVDAAFGAAHLVGPKIFARLGARVVAINDEDDGSRINVACGATDLRMLQGRVRDEIARTSGPVVGVAFDGDADRALFVDERGDILNGDRVMLILARDLAGRGELPANTVVGTVMSNMGFEKALEREGLRLVRAAVGDRYVLEAMRGGGYRFGGEQSGHVIDLQRGTTGDGPMTAVALFSIAARTRTPLRDLAAGMSVYPQVLVNVRVADKSVGDHPAVRDAIAAAERVLAGDGRILVRPSGTEPLVRVMVESTDEARTRDVAESVARTIRGLTPAV